MITKGVTDPNTFCEGVLCEERQYNEDHSIWPGQNRVIDLMLARRIELDRAYDELHAKLSSHPHAIREFFRLLLATAALWNPERNAEARAARDRLATLNHEISSSAWELAALLEERSNLHNTSSFHTNTHYHVGQIIEQAAEGNAYYRMYLHPELKRLRGQFDLKYWPMPCDFVRVLAADAENATLEASDPLTDAATSSSRASKADSIKALLASIEENRERNHGWIPDAIKLTDETLASLVNCAFDFGPDEVVDGAYLKRLRQRQRSEIRNVRGPAISCII